MVMPQGLTAASVPPDARARCAPAADWVGDL